MSSGGVPRASAPRRSSSGPSAELFLCRRAAAPGVEWAAVRAHVAFRVVLAILALWLTAAPAWAQNGRPLALSAESVLLLNPQGKVLFAKNPSEDHAPASLVKLMTLYLACEALEAGRAQWEEPVVIRDRKSTRLNSSHIQKSRMPSSA